MTKQAQQLLDLAAKYAKYAYLLEEKLRSSHNDKRYSRIAMYQITCDRLSYLSNYASEKLTDKRTAEDDLFAYYKQVVKEKHDIINDSFSDPTLQAVVRVYRHYQKELINLV